MTGSYPLLRALLQIADYQRGGIVIAGQISGDRDEMIGIARQAIIEFAGIQKLDAAKQEAERLLSVEECFA